MRPSPVIRAPCFCFVQYQLLRGYNATAAAAVNTSDVLLTPDASSGSSSSSTVPPRSINWVAAGACVYAAVRGSGGRTVLRRAVSCRCMVGQCGSGT